MMQMENEKPLPSTTPEPGPSWTPHGIPTGPVLPMPPVIEQTPYVLEGIPQEGAATAYYVDSYDEALALLTPELNCVDSAPALDQIDSETWWAYCEPALVGIGEAEYTEAHTGYPPHVNATAIATPPPDIPRVVLAETGGVDITGPLAFIGTLTIILGAATIGHVHHKKKGARQ